ncbi:FtsB family cell division protein [Microbacterium sp. TNHR37B]|uniref:FtsB family cell division protein n=1 Tax=Microbacterium sp. TNHR37B TaxID=1775956 RepID=UPI0007B23452|nr:septum formation initiator family protein [Microbacterium sp. TNHR37B]KZE91371.1 Cell division protein FtsL [Microbacterium sp. TNHR37B]
MNEEGARRAASAPSSPSRSQVDVRDWVGRLRLTAFTGIMLGLVVLAALVLVPSVGTYLDQRQQIAALRQAVTLGKDEIAELQLERERWADPAYVTAQARERLYYYRPGEVVYLVDDDLPASAIPQEQAPVSEDVEETRTDWMAQLVRSVAAAGLSRPAVGE